MLTSRAREMLSGVEAVIVDEIHAVAHSKRGSHLALTLERLEAQGAAAGRRGHGRGLQRIGLSATQNPLEEIGRFLVGPQRQVKIIDAGARKPLDLRIEVPVESMANPRARWIPSAIRSSRWRAARRHGPRSGRPSTPSCSSWCASTPLDDHLRQQPPRRRARGAAAQRAGRRAGRRCGVGPPRPASSRLSATARSRRARSRARTTARSRARSAPWSRSC